MHRRISSKLAGHHAVTSKNFETCTSQKKRAYIRIVSLGITQMRWWYKNKTKHFNNPQKKRKTSKNLVLKFKLSFYASNDIKVLGRNSVQQAIFHTRTPGPAISTSLFRASIVVVKHIKRRAKKERIEGGRLRFIHRETLRNLHVRDAVWVIPNPLAHSCPVGSKKTGMGKKSLHTNGP